MTGLQRRRTLQEPVGYSHRKVKEVSFEAWGEERRMKEGKTT